MSWYFMSVVFHVGVISCWCYFMSVVFSVNGPFLTGAWSEVGKRSL